MAETLHRVELTDSFLARLEALEAFLIEADAGAAFDDLLDQLRSTVIPNLARFPRIGRRYLDHPPQSAEALGLLAAIPTGAADSPREHLHDDYIMLYTCHSMMPWPLYASAAASHLTHRICLPSTLIIAGDGFLKTC